MENGDGSDFSAVDGNAALADREREHATKIAPVPIFLLPRTVERILKMLDDRT